MWVYSAFKTVYKLRSRSFISQTMDDIGMALDDIDDINELIGQFEQDGALQAVVDKITENVSNSIRLCFHS